MADEVLGVAEVQIVADNQAALSSVDAIIARLEQLNKKLDATAQKFSKLTAGEGPATSRATTNATQEAASTRRAQGSDVGRTQRGQDLQGNIDLKVNAQSVITQIQHAFDSHVFTIRVQLDTAEIQRQLSGGHFTMAATPTPSGGSTVTHHPPAQTQTSAQHVPSSVMSAINASQPDPERLGRVARYINKVSPGANVAPPASGDAGEIQRFLQDAARAMGIQPGSMASTPSATVGKKQYPAGVQSWVANLASQTGLPFGPTRATIEGSGIAPLLHAVTQAAPPPVVQPQPVTVAQTTPIAGLRMDTTAEQQARVDAMHEQQAAEEMARRMSATPSRTYARPEALLDEILGKYTAKGRSRSGRGAGRTTGAKGLGIRIDAQGNIIDESPAFTDRQRAKAQRGPLTINGVDVTPLARALGAGEFSGYYEGDEGLSRGAMDENGKFSLPLGAKKVGPTEVLRQMLQLATGGEVSNTLITALTRKQDPKVAPLAGAATGYFAPFMEQSRRAFQPGLDRTNQAGQPVQGQYILGPGLQANAREDLFAGGGEGVLPGVAMGQGIGERPEFMGGIQSRDARRRARRMNSIARNAQRASQGRISEEHADRLRAIGAMGPDLTTQQLGSVIGERAGMARAEITNDEINSLVGVIDMLTDPSNMPTHAAEQVGRIASGQSLNRREAIEYRVGQIMAATNLPGRLGIQMGRNPSYALEGDTGLIGRFGRAPGGSVISAALRAASAKLSTQIGDESAANRRMAGVDDRATGVTQKDVSMVPKLGSESRLESIQALLDIAAGKTAPAIGVERIPTEAEILARHANTIAPRYATEEANAARDDRGSLTPLPAPSTWEKGKSPADIKAGVARAAKGDLDARAARVMALTQTAEREKKITILTKDIVDRLRGTEAGSKIYDRAGLNTLLGPADTEGDESLRQAVINNLYGATHRGGRSFPLETAVAPKTSLPTQRVGLNRGEVGAGHPVGGFRATTIPGGGPEGEDLVIKTANVSRAPSTRIRGEGGTLLTGDETRERAAAAAGHTPAGIVSMLAEEKRQASIAEAVNTANEITPGAGAMVVTIAGPIPVPVSVVNMPTGMGGGGGSGGGGGGGGRRPTAEGSSEEEPKKPETALARQRRIEQEAKEASAAVGLGLGPLPDRRPMPAGLGTVTGPGFRLPGLSRAAVGLNPIEQQTQAGLELERTQDAAAIKQQREMERQERAAAAAARKREQSGITMAQRDIEMERRREDPHFAAAQAIIQGRLGVSPGDELTAQQRELEYRMFPAARRLAAQRERQTRATQADAERAARATGTSASDPQALGDAQLRRMVAAAGQQFPEGNFDPDSVDIEGIAEGAQAKARAAEQVARGKLAQRALSTTLIQLSQNMFANRERPLVELANVARERGDLTTLTRQRIAAEREGGLLRQTRSVVATSRDLTLDPNSEQYKSVTVNLANFDKQIEENAATVADLTKKENDQAEKIVGMAKAAVKTSDVLANLGAGVVGGIAGGLVTMAVGAATQGVMHLVETAVVPAIDRATGNNLTAQRVNQQLGGVAMQSGFSQSAITEQLVNAGLTQGQIAQMRGGLIPEAMGSGGVEMAQQRLDMSIAAQSNRAQQAQLGLPSGIPPILYRGQGAALSLPGNIPFLDELVNGPTMDIGGQDSVQKMFASMINNVTRSDSAELAALNTRFGDTGIRVRPGSSVEREADRTLMRERGAGDLFQALEAHGLVLDGLNGNVDRLDQALVLFNSGTKDFAAILENQATSVGFQNQLALAEMNRTRSLQTAQMQSGLQGLGSPVLPAGTGIPGGGSATFQRQFIDMQSKVQSFEAQGVKMLSSLVPDELISEYRTLGETIGDLGVEAGNIQAAQSMRAYQMQVTQARYAVEDLMSITGRGEGSEIGRLERQNMLMQRRLQLLQFEQQQRRLNFGVAVAGFQSIGLTGEERAANLRIARKEAAIGQEQLDISKGMFGNQVQIVDQQNLRQLRLAVMSLENVSTSFRENRRLAEIGQLVSITNRRQRQLEEKIGINLQAELQLMSMRDQFAEQIATETNTLLTATDVYARVVRRFDRANGSIKDSLAAIEGIMGESPSGNSGSGAFRDLNINVAGNVVNIKQLVDKTVEEIGRLFGLSGGS